MQCRILHQYTEDFDIDLVNTLILMYSYKRDKQLFIIS